MYKLKNHAVKPPGGIDHGSFFYKQPETGMEFDKDSLFETVAAVSVHRTTNGLARASEVETGDDVEDQICKRVGHQWCRNMKAEQWGFRLGWDDIKAGTKTLATQAVRTLQGQVPWVVQAEAERRAAICVKCFANRRGGGCLSCGFMDLVREVISHTCADVQTKVDDRLNSCECCGCLLKCKVHYKDSVLIAGMSERQKSAYADIPECWMNTLDEKKG